MKLPAGLVAQPGSSVDNHTGGWRTERPVFLHERCTGCDLCVLFCPEGIVRREADRTYTFDPDYCKGCAICVEECPVDDILMEVERR